MYSAGWNRRNINHMESLRDAICYSKLPEHVLNELFFSNRGKKRSYWMSEWGIFFADSQMSDVKKKFMYINIALLLKLMYLPRLTSGKRIVDFPWIIAMQILRYLTCTYKKNKYYHYSPKEQVFFRLTDLLICMAIQYPNTKANIMETLKKILGDLPKNVVSDVLLHCPTIVMKHLRDKEIVQALVPDVIINSKSHCNVREYIKLAFLWKITVEVNSSLSKQLWRKLPLQPKKLPSWLKQRNLKNIFSSKKVLKEIDYRKPLLTIYTSLYRFTKDENESNSLSVDKKESECSSYIPDSSQYSLSVDKKESECSSYIPDSPQYSLSVDKKESEWPSYSPASPQYSLSVDKKEWECSAYIPDSAPNRYSPDSPPPLTPEISKSTADLPNSKTPSKVKDLVFYCFSNSSSTVEKSQDVQILASPKADETSDGPLTLGTSKITDSEIDKILSSEKNESMTPPKVRCSSSGSDSTDSVVSVKSGRRRTVCCTPTRRSKRIQTPEKKTEEPPLKRALRSLVPKPN